ncbi:MAG: superoxide dismutase [Myxococcota bacterium]
MKFEIPELPYPKHALEPYISRLTLETHYEKHHKGYVKKLRKEIEGKPEADRSLEDVIRSSEGKVFNFAAQVWNHTFYWRSMRPDGGGKPSGPLLEKIEQDFESFDAFQHAFADAATGEFGSGWAWLVVDGRGRLRVRSSSDAENPLGTAQTPLLTIDVWEHAYYLDYKNERDRHVQAVIEHLLDWDFARENFEAVAKPAGR